MIAEGGPAGLALQKLLAVLGERLGWSRVEFWEFDRVTRTVRPAQSWGTARGGTSWGRKARACAAATDPEPVWHEEISGGGSLVVFPVLCSTEVAGVVLLNSAGRRAVDGDLMALFRILGGQLGQFFERTRLEKEVMEITQREQRRIGQDLHDGLGQLLVGASRA